MQAQPGDAKANCYIGCDGTYETRGFQSPHGGVDFRSMEFWGALLGSLAISRNDPDNPCVTTSASIERVCFHDMYTKTYQTHTPLLSHKLILLCRLVYPKLVSA